MGTWRTRGMSAHTTISVDIIDTMLREPPSASPQNTAQANRAHKGCRLVMPNRDASRPVRNGSTAEPAWPTPAM